MFYGPLVASVVEKTDALPISAGSFGAITLITFVALLGLTWSFRNTSNRHR